MPALTAVQIDLPDGAGIEDLPDDFGDLSDMARTQTFGDVWVREQRSLALRVPSLVVQQDWNLLLNPDHPDMVRVKVVQQIAFAFDTRLAP